MEIERDASGRYVKGKSGNPTGRPKGDALVREVLRAHSVEAARKMIGLLDSESDKIVFMAAQEILNRTEGKPMQAVDMQVRGEVDMRSQIRDLLLERMNERGKAEVTD